MIANFPMDSVPSLEKNFTDLRALIVSGESRTKIDEQIFQIARCIRRLRFKHDAASCRSLYRDALEGVWLSLSHVAI